MTKFLSELLWGWCVFTKKEEGVYSMCCMTWEGVQWGREALQPNSWLDFWFRWTVTVP